MASPMRYFRAISGLIALTCAVVLFGGCASGAATPAAGGTVRAGRSPGPGSTVAAEAKVHTCAQPYPSGPPTVETVFCADPSKMQTARVVRIVDGGQIR